MAGGFFPIKARRGNTIDAIHFEVKTTKKGQEVIVADYLAGWYTD